MTEEKSDADVRKAWERTMQDQLNLREKLAEKARTSPEPEEVDDSPRNREELYEEIIERRQQEIAEEVIRAKEAQEQAEEEALDRYYAEQEKEDDEEYLRSVERITDEDEHKLLIGEIEGLQPEMMANPLWRKRWADRCAEELRDNPETWDDGRLYKRMADEVALHMQQSAEDPAWEKKHDRDYTRLGILTN